MGTRYTFTGDGINLRINGLPHNTQVQRMEVTIPDSVEVKAGPVNDTGGYVSEIAWALLNGAPQYAVNEQGQTIYVPTGEVVPSVTPTLKERYKSARELLDDIAAQNYTRKVIVDGTLLPFTQYGSEPAAYYGSEAGSGDLLALEVPTVPPTVTIDPSSPSQNTGLTGPVVFEVAKEGRVFIEGIEEQAYVAHLSAKGLKDGFGHFSLSEVPGSPTVARTREIALDGKVVEARGLPSVSSDVTYQVKSERFVTLNDAPIDAYAMEVSWIGDQSAAFFVESHPPV